MKKVLSFFVFTGLVGIVFSTSAFGSVGSANTNGAEQGIFTDQIKNHENSLNLALPQEENSFDILAQSDEKKKKKGKKKGTKKKKKDVMDDKTEGKMEGKDKEPDSGHEDIEKKEGTTEGHSKE